VKRYAISFGRLPLARSGLTSRIEDWRRNQMKKDRKKIATLPVIETNAAGIDIGATQIYVAVPPDRDTEVVRCFGTFTADLEKLADWLEACQIRTAAMELD